MRGKGNDHFFPLWAKFEKPSRHQSNKCWVWVARRFQLAGFLNQTPITVLVFSQEDHVEGEKIPKELLSNWQSHKINKTSKLVRGK